MNDGGKVVPLRPPTAPRADARTRFYAARRDMLTAYTEWLNEHPDRVDVQEELDATGGVLRQLRDLLLNGPA